MGRGSGRLSRRDRPAGPSTWEAGSYPDGKADFPVGGLSWYEAEAYAKFAGKSLPTVYHWYIAAGVGANSQITSLSNFGGQGPARVGSRALVQTQADWEFDWAPPG